MNQITARNIISSLPSLYPLKELEEEAIITLLQPLPLTQIGEEDYSCERSTSYLVCPNCSWELATDNFCCKCGQPLIEDDTF